MPEVLAFMGKELKIFPNDISGLLLHKWLELHVRVATLHMCDPRLVCVADGRGLYGIDKVPIPAPRDLPQTTLGGGLETLQPEEPETYFSAFSKRLEAWFDEGEPDDDNGDHTGGGQPASALTPPEDQPQLPPPAYPPSGYSSDGERTGSDVESNGEQLEASPDGILAMHKMWISQKSEKVAGTWEPTEHSVMVKLERKDGKKSLRMWVQSDDGRWHKCHRCDKAIPLSVDAQAWQDVVNEVPKDYCLPEDFNDELKRYIDAQYLKRADPVQGWHADMMRAPPDLESIPDQEAERDIVEEVVAEESYSWNETWFEELANVTYTPRKEVDFTPFGSFMYEHSDTGTGFVMPLPEKVPKGHVRRDLLLSGMVRKEVDRRMKDMEDMVYPLQPGASLYQKEDLDMRKFAMTHRKRELRIEREQRIADEKILGEGNERFQFYYLIKNVGHNANLHAAASHTNNAIHAMCFRHYKTTLFQPNPTLNQIFDDISKVMTTQLLMELYNSTFTEEFIEKLTTENEYFKSGKWTLERWRQQLRKAIIKSACQAKGPNTEQIGSILREITSKGNEGLPKQKPRGICAAGDVGCCLHSIGGVGFVEQVLTRIEVIEAHSIKHTDVRGIGSRIKTLINAMGMDCYAGSDDFGSFDGTVRQYIDGRLIVPILEAVCNTLLHNFPLAEDAMADLKKDSLKARIEGNWRFTAKAEVASRESGDRGTSLKNLLANKFLFLMAYALERLYRSGVVKIKKQMKSQEQKAFEERYMALNGLTDISDTLKVDIKPATWDKAGYQPWVDVEGDKLWIPSANLMTTEQKKSYQDVIEDCRHWCNPHMSRHKEVRGEANLIGEGDDGLQLLSRRFKEAGGPSFGSRWVLFYREMGFQLEPQCPSGEVPAKDLDKFAFIPALQRMEFISRIWVPIRSADGTKVERVWSYPKPTKSLTKCLISFSVGETIENAGYSKFLAMMGNCIDIPVLYAFAHMYARHYEGRGGIFSKDCLTHFNNKRLVSSSKEVIRNKFAKFTQTDVEARMCVQRSFERETGLSVAEQDRVEAKFDSVTRNPEHAALPFLATFGVVERPCVAKACSRW